MYIMKINVKTRAKVVEAYLNKLFPAPETELNFSSNFELLVAVILSAQCTDIRVNKVTSVLFKTHCTPKDFVEITQEELEKKIYSCGFYSQKAMSIKQASKDIIDKFNGDVPNTLEDLMTLRGVGRKTANVVLSVAFGVPAIAVDTHVFRVSRRLGLSSGKTVWEVEQDLMKLFRKEIWTKLHYQLVLYGRYNSKARGESKWEEEFLEFEKKFLEENPKL
jgi:endonuclease-3